MKKTGENKICGFCGAIFYASGWWLKREGGGKYCGRTCANKSRIGYRQSLQTIEKRMANNRRENSPQWRGGKIEHNGYFLIYKPDHPNCDSKGYVREHRLKMEKKIGRLLRKDEVVHHADGDRKNNNNNNLILFGTHSEHMKFEFNKV